MGKAVAYVALQEHGKSATVIDIEDRATPCRACGSAGPVFSVHCWWEEARPLVALRRSCAVKRAGGPECVAVRSDRAGLAEGWRQNLRPLLSDKQREQRQNASRRRQQQKAAASG